MAVASSVLLLAFRRIMLYGLCVSRSLSSTERIFGTRYRACWLGIALAARRRLIWLPLHGGVTGGRDELTCNHHRSAPGLRPGTEALERRELLSADASMLAQSPMAPATPSDPAAMTMHVSRSEFTFHNDRVLLSLAIQAPAGSSGPMTMTMTPQKGSSEKILSKNNEPSGGARDVFVVSVGPGNYVVQAEMPDATGPLQLSMSLVGDVNGDHKVTAQDIRLIRSLKGLSVGQPGYSLAADPTAAGTINAKDVFLARINLGAAMKVEPLALTAGLDPSSNPDGNGVVTSPNVTISGQTAPGATVKLDQGDTGTFTQTTTADAQGNYQFAGVRRDRRDAVPRRGRRRRPAGDGRHESHPR